jgi:AraC-like DNA-binding protein
MVLEAAERGLDAGPLLSRLGLDAQTLASPERRVPFAALFSVWADCMRALRDPGLPIAAAQRIRLEDYTALGFALTAASSVRAAVSTLVRYGRFIGDGDSWGVEERADGNLRLRWERAGERTLGHRVANECAIAEALHAARQMVGERVVPAAVAFRHAAPRPLDAHLEFFGLRPSFGADWEGLELPRPLLARVPRLANPPLAAYLEAQLASSLAKHPAPAAAFSERVVQLLEQDLASGEPALTTIARALATSERTLRRALQKERLTFRGLWDSVRRRRAEELLAAGRVTIDETAFLTGFSETSAFARAFKRWSGETPGAYRARRAGAGRIGQEIGRQRQ